MHNRSAAVSNLSGSREDVTVVVLVVDDEPDSSVVRRAVPARPAPKRFVMDFAHFGGGRARANCNYDQRR